MSYNYNNVINTFDEICTSLTKDSDLIDQDLIFEIQNLGKQFKDNVEDILEKNRVLKIGIVGEVKAGKSSFLNAMLFNGDEVLPKAPTPMTAALTKITYSDKLTAKIVYYNQYDWQIIGERALQYKTEYKKLRQEYIQRNFFQSSNKFGNETDEKDIQRYIEKNISKELRACNELVEMLEERNLYSDDYLGKEIIIENVDEIEDFIGMLDNYVGANGKFTPLVKHTEISLNLPILQGIEIVDTPGTNDPIISRGITTRKFLGQCDVVFLLSYSGQFLSSDDMTFLMSMLPSEGISNAVLIGSKFDSAVLDNNKSGKDLKMAVALSRKNMVDYVKATISEALKVNDNNIILKRIEKSLPPEFVSSIFYTIGKKNCENLNKQEEFIIDNFKRRFDDFKFKPEYLIGLSNIERVKKNKLEHVRTEKEKIIAERTNEIIITKLRVFLGLLEKVNIDVTDRYELLLNFDKKQLEQKYNRIETELETIRYNVKHIFEKNINGIEREVAYFKLELEKAQINYSIVQVGEKEEEHGYIVRTGFFGFKKEYHTRYTTIRYADTNQVVKNLQEYVLYLKGNIIEKFNNIIKIELFKQELKKSVISIFDLSDSNFRENEILGPVELVLEKITIPKLTIAREKYENIIVKKFSSGVVEGNDIHELVRIQNETLNLIFTDIALEVNKLSDEICRNLMSQSKEFVDNIIKKVSVKAEQLKLQIDEKEQFVKKYNNLINDIKRNKSLIKKMMAE